MKIAAKKGFFLVFAVALTLMAVQPLWASEVFTVDGVIEEISYKPNMVVVDGTEVYGTKFKMLESYNISIAEGDYVSFQVYEYLCSTGELKYKAVSITVGDVTVVLRDTP